MTHIFVFGSNQAGIHGRGSAKAAKDKHGAVGGIGSGRTGNAYAIPTRVSPWGDILPLAVIALYVTEFIEYATAHSGLTFDVVRIGCGLSRYDDVEIAPLFKGAPINVALPFGWREIALPSSGER